LKIRTNGALCGILSFLSIAEDNGTMGDIRKMLNPAVVALIGATEREGSIGKRILDNLLGRSGRPRKSALSEADGSS